MAAFVEKPSSLGIQQTMIEEITSEFISAMDGISSDIDTYLVQATENERLIAQLSKELDMLNGKLPHDQKPSHDQHGPGLEISGEAKGIFKTLAEGLRTLIVINEKLAHLAKEGDRSRQDLQKSLEKLHVLTGTIWKWIKDFWSDRLRLISD